MSKVVLPPVASGFRLSEINSRFATIENELNNKVYYRDSPIGEPNTLETDMDANGKQIYNVSTLRTSSLEINGFVVEPGDAVSAATVQVFEFVATAGQSSFSITPLEPTSAGVIFEVNGITYPTSVISVAGSAVNFPELNAGDEVVLRVFTRDIGGLPDSSQITHIDTEGNSTTVQATLQSLEVLLSNEDIDVSVGPLEIIAHRGFVDQFPQNTMAAFSLALSRGAVALETDIQISSDGVPILFHDTTVDALTNGSGAVTSLSLATLQGLTFDSLAGTPLSSIRIPTLAEFLKYCRERGVAAYVEIKGYRTQADIALIVEAVEAAGMASSTVFYSYIESDLSYVLALNPLLKVSSIMDTYITDYEAFLTNIAATGRSAVLFTYADVIVRTAMVAYAKNLGLDISCATLNTLEEARKVTRLGIRKLISDTPLGF